MGVYDREYYREEPQGFFGSGRRSAVLDIIILNVAIYLLDLFSEGWLTKHFALQTDLFQHPWQVYQLITCGFLHDQQHIGHILFNMIALFFFGRDVEQVYGRKRFIQVYLSALVFSSLLFVIGAAATHSVVPAVGASGAIMGILVIYAMHFPNRQFLLYFVIPVPAWLLVILYVAMDFLGVIRPSAEDNVAHTAHLGGAAFGYLFYKTGWTFANLWPAKWSLPKMNRGPSLRVHAEEDEPEEDPKLWQAKVDAILEKISQRGEGSLTSEERKLLEEASRRYQQRRQ